jgi:hypothetical protein
VTLNEDLVGTGRVIVALEEVIEANLIQRGTGGKRRNVSTDRDAWTLSAVHHDRGIPTHPGTIGALDLLVTRELGLVFW